jgi:hypothetical protein
MDTTQIDTIQSEINGYITILQQAYNRGECDKDVANGFVKLYKAYKAISKGEAPFAHEFTEANNSENVRSIYEGQNLTFSGKTENEGICKALNHWKQELSKALGYLISITDLENQQDVVYCSIQADMEPWMEIQLLKNYSVVTSKPLLVPEVRNDLSEFIVVFSRAIASLLEKGPYNEVRLTAYNTVLFMLERSRFCLGKISQHMEPLDQQRENSLQEKAFVEA